MWLPEMGGKRKVVRVHAIKHQEWSTAPLLLKLCHTAGPDRDSSFVRLSHPILSLSLIYIYIYMRVWVRRGRCIGSWWGNRREGNHWRDLGVDGYIILGWIYRRWDVGIWTGLGWPRIETSGGQL